jgi:nucleoside phosphorylase
MTGLVFATVEEATPFLERYERGRFEELTEGDLLTDDKIMITILGSGKVKATLRTERFLRAHRPDRVLHVGLCTALKPAQPTGTVVAMHQVFEGDRIEMAAPSYPRIPLENIDSDLVEGVLVTQDHLVQDGSEQTYWQRIADYQDSTGYAVAYVAATHGIPVSIIKSIGGHAGESSKDVRASRRHAAESIANFLTAYFA